MLIRDAVDTDVPQIVKMGSRSIQEGPYKHYLPDAPEVTEKTASDIIKRADAKVLVSEEDAKLTGVMAFVVFPHYYSDEITTEELIWYVEPEFRKSMTAICLLRAAERIAREMGAKWSQFTAPTDAVGTAYKALGYTPVETTYLKAL